MGKEKKGFCTAVLLVLVCWSLGYAAGCSRTSNAEAETETEAGTEIAGPAGPAGSADEAVPAAEAPQEVLQETGPEGAAEEAAPQPDAEVPAPVQPGAATVQAVAVNDIPEALRMPRRGEAPRFPQDRFIGPLGRGDADADAYRYALRLMETLLLPEGREAALSGLGEVAAGELFRILDEVKPGNFRMGAFQDEGDGACSFLVRFMGSGKSSAGEVYIRLAEERWTLEDMILEEEPEGEVSRFDYPSYQQFF